VVSRNSGGAACTWSPDLMGNIFGFAGSQATQPPVPYFAQVLERTCDGVGATIMKPLMDEAAPTALPVRHHGGFQQQSFDAALSAARLRAGQNRAAIHRDGVASAGTWNPSRQIADIFRDHGPA
jgi:hypothetical protein